MALPATAQVAEMFVKAEEEFLARLSTDQERLRILAAERDKQLAELVRCSDALTKGPSRNNHRTCSVHRLW